MGIDFNADEVFEIAEQIERNGAKFYRSIAEKVNDTNKKQLLANLAKMEDEHEQTFKTLRSKLSTDEKIQTTFDPEGESERYLRALADTRVFYEKDVKRILGSKGRSEVKKRKCEKCGILLRSGDVMKIKLENGSWESVPIPICPHCFKDRMQKLADTI